MPQRPRTTSIALLVGVVAVAAGAVALLVTSATPPVTGLRASLAAAGMPLQVGGLTVVSVPEAIALRDAGSTARIAVGGWHEYGDTPCGPIELTPRFEECALSAVMPNPSQRTEPWNPGIRLVGDIPTAPSPTGIVAVGHFHDPGAAACPSGERREACDGEFAVQTIAWLGPQASPSS